MRVLFYVHGFPYFHNTFVYQLVVEAERRGHEVRLVSWFDPSPGRRNSAVASHRLAERTHYLTEGERQCLEPLWRVDDLEADLVRRAGVRFGTPLDDLLDDCDLVHAAFANNSATVALALAAAARKAFVFEAHAYDLFVDFSHAPVKLRRAAAIVTISHHNRCHLEALDAGVAGRIFVKRVTVDRALGAVAAAGRPREPNLMVSVCRLHPIKGLEHAMDAFALIAARVPRLRHVVIGDGPLRGALEQRAVALGLRERVAFLGDLPSHEVVAWMARAQFTVLPSVIATDGDRDGIPTSLVEAMWLGTPAIASRLSGLPELVQDGVNGLLVTPGDVTGLAVAVERLATDAGLARRLGAAAARSVRQDFDVDRNMAVLDRAWSYARQQAATVGHAARDSARG